MINCKFGTVLLIVLLSLHNYSCATIETRSEDAKSRSRDETSSSNTQTTSVSTRIPFNPNSCPPGTYPSGDKCWRLGSNCLTYDSDGACLSCSPNMKTVKGRCVPIANRVETCLEGTQGNCTKCAPNTVNTKPGYCEQIQPKCRRFNSEGVCIICGSHLILDRNLCLSHLPPMFAYADDNCDVWQNGKCIECRAGWQNPNDDEPCIENLMNS